ncbi:protein ADP-ribosyltransferase [Clostridiales bacterium]|nr:protein ADP-ribosyltransferase [Clostridiales bacterium]
MFLKTKIMKSTNSYLNSCKRLKKEIETASAIVIGAGSGLSTSAGFTYSGKRFEENFPDFIEKYNFRDMYSAGFYPYKTLEEYWAFWSRYIYINRYQDAPHPVYNELLKLVQNKNYFILTTNVDHCFQKAGFDKNRLFYTQGDYGLWQCSIPCHNKTYDNEVVVKRMVIEQRNMSILPDLIPRCPLCHAPMTMNLRSDNTFVEDEGWKKASVLFHDFLHQYSHLNILYLELGVGRNTPGIIKYPFWNLTYKNPKAIYACINLSDIYVPNEIKEQSICILGDIGDILKQLV